ncbi:MAG: hypothetical protein IJ197_05810 [Bacteroidaceae bacterium]|nr:hypothetical protein [Bacteroidaceae bacterium]
MFDKETFRQLTYEVESDLVEGRLHDALKVLTESLTPELSPALQREAATIRDDYDRLLHYMAEGTEDDSRPTLYARFLTKAHRILQKLKYDYRQANERDKYAMTAHLYGERWQEHLERAISTLETGMDYERLDLLFELLWVAPQLDSNVENRLQLFLIATDPNTRKYLLSALTLALLLYFDPAKMRLLMAYATSDHEAERARALVGICFATQVHSRLASLYPTLWEELAHLTEQAHFAEMMGQLQLQLCLYQDSERLRQKMEKEILPILIKASRDRAKLGFDSEQEIDLSSPETALNLSKENQKRIEASMKEMAEMFMEGVDLNLNTFTSLKGFPFFQHIGHWLAPFDANRPEVTDGHLLSKFHLCDSDLYSLALLTQRIPAEQRQGISKMLSEHAEEVELQAKEVGVSPMQNVVQCLYRLLKRSSWLSLWPDVFSKDNQLILHPLFGKALGASPNFLLATGNLLFRHAHYEEALAHLMRYAEKNGLDSNLARQMGFCEQQLGHDQKAISHLRQADMLEPDNSQTLYHLQLCYARMERYEEQLDCLLQLEKLHPEDPRILTETGLCLMQLKRWEEAQKRFFQMELRGQRLLPSLRAIAWCALRMQDYDLASRYYDRILGEELARTKWEDFLNAGHVAWLKGDTPLALTRYHEYARRYASANPEARDILEPYHQDEEVLVECGKSLSDIHLMHDLIAREL